MNNNYYLRLESLVYTSNFAYVFTICITCINIASISAIHIPQDVGK
jgi:hypothetical protein